MAEPCINRLTILGQPNLVARVQWEPQLEARYIELLEQSPKRMAWTFETQQAPLRALAELSRRWPKVTLLLDYDHERVKGMARARGGTVELHQIQY